MELKACPFIEALQTIHDYLLESVKPWDSAHQTIFTLIDSLLINTDGNCVNRNTRSPAEKWISVKDRLPEIKVMVITHSQEYGVVIGFYDPQSYGKWHAEHTDYETGEPWLPDAKITHWQPLPEAPEGI